MLLLSKVFGDLLSITPAELEILAELDSKRFGLVRFKPDSPESASSGGESPPAPSDGPSTSTAASNDAGAAAEETREPDAESDANERKRRIALKGVA